MADPLAYQELMDFNTEKHPEYAHLIESAPSPGEPDKVRSLCRCWQSLRFPYCDGTHKLLQLEGGDNVGPVLVRVRSFSDRKATSTSQLQRYIPNTSKMATVGGLAAAAVMGYIVGEVLKEPKKQQNCGGFGCTSYIFGRWRSNAFEGNKQS